MLQTQQRFLDYLDAVQAELGKASSVGDIQKNIQAIDPLKQELAETELIVPVVGAFSAGKSTLINSFLGDGPLPVGITPETALATELRHSASEYVEGIRADGEADRFAVAEITALKEQAQQYQYAKVFLNSEPLREILPLVLVDMPGFDSPLDLHHRAILTYLSRGSHYAVLISVEEGTVTRSAQRQFSEIHEAGKEFSVFLSKADLRPDSEVADIAGNIAEQLENGFGFGGSVERVSMDDGQRLARMLHAINPEELFGKLWRPDLEAHFFELDGSLNTQISSLQKDERENQEAIDELAAGLRELQRKKEEMVEDVRARYSTDRTRAIAEGVGADLGAAVEELTQLAMSGGADALQRELSEIARTSLMRRTKEEMGRLHQEIAEDLTGSLEGVSATLFSYDDTSTEQYLGKIPLAIRGVSELLGGLATATKAAKGGLTLYRGITAAVAITTSVVMPLLELVVVFLPDIINFFRKRRQEEEIRNQLIGTVIPSVQSKIRSELPKHFDEQVNALIDEQAKVLDEHLKARQDEIAAAERTKQDAVRDIEQTIAELTGIRDHIRSLANQALFAQGETENG